MKLSRRNLRNRQIDIVSEADVPLRSYNNIRNRQNNYRQSRPSKVLTTNSFQYTLCNSRFVVAYINEWHLDICNVDKLYDWSKILYIICPLDDFYKCPICLDSLIYPVSFKCGHVFCLECTVESFRYSTDSITSLSTQCSVCYALLFIDDLRITIFERTIKRILDDIVSFDLFKRVNNHSILFDVHKNSQSFYLNDTKDIEYKDCCLIFNKVFHGKYYEMSEQISKLITTPVITYLSNDIPAKKMLQHDDIAFIVIERCKNTLSRLMLSCNDINFHHFPIDCPLDADFKYLYQDTYNDKCFLDQNNIKQLLKTFHKLENASPNLIVRVKNIETVVIDEDFRSKNKYLNYLPLRTQISRLFVDIIDPFIDVEIVNMFQKPVIIDKTTQHSYSSRRDFTDDYVRYIPPVNPNDDILIFSTSSTNEFPSLTLETNETDPNVITNQTLSSTFIDDATMTPTLQTKESFASAVRHGPTFSNDYNYPALDTEQPKSLDQLGKSLANVKINGKKQNKRTNIQLN